MDSNTRKKRIISAEFTSSGSWYLTPTPIPSPQRTRKSPKNLRNPVTTKDYYREVIGYLHTTELISKASLLSKWHYSTILTDSSMHNKLNQMIKNEFGHDLMDPNGTLAAFLLRDPENSNNVVVEKATISSFFNNRHAKNKNNMNMNKNVNINIISSVLNERNQYQKIYHVYHFFVTPQERFRNNIHKMSNMILNNKDKRDLEIIDANFWKILQNCNYNSRLALAKQDRVEMLKCLFFYHNAPYNGFSALNKYIKLYTNINLNTLERQVEKPVSAFIKFLENEYFKLILNESINILECACISIVANDQVNVHVSDNESDGGCSDISDHSLDLKNSWVFEKDVFYSWADKSSERKYCDHWSDISLYCCVNKERESNWISRMKYLYLNDGALSYYVISKSNNFYHRIFFELGKCFDGKRRIIFSEKIFDDLIYNLLSCTLDKNFNYWKMVNYGNCKELHLKICDEKNYLNLLGNNFVKDIIEFIQFESTVKLYLKQIIRGELKRENQHQKLKQQKEKEKEKENENKNNNKNKKKYKNTNTNKNNKNKSGGLTDSDKESSSEVENDNENQGEYENDKKTQGEKAPLFRDFEDKSDLFSIGLIKFDAQAKILDELTNRIDNIDFKKIYKLWTLFFEKVLSTATTQTAKDELINDIAWIFHESYVTHTKGRLPDYDTWQKIFRYLPSSMHLNFAKVSNKWEGHLIPKNSY